MPEEAKSNNSKKGIFMDRLDQYRIMLEKLYVFGCYGSAQLAQECKCSPDKIKKAKNFYDVCMDKHIGRKHIIATRKTEDGTSKSGRKAEASYLTLKRFSYSENYMYSAYLWSRIETACMWKYFIYRQYIKQCKAEIEKWNDNTELANDRVAKLKKYISDYYKSDPLFSKYFSASHKRENEDVDEFLKKICTNLNTIDGAKEKKREIKMISQRLIDALILYARKAPYSVPAYSIIYKIKKVCKDNLNATLNTLLWDFNYDNFDRILYDDSVYKIIYAVKNERIIGYTETAESKVIKFAIPFRIIQEYNLGRTYLVCYSLDLEKLDKIKLDENNMIYNTVRFDSMYNIKIYDVKDSLKNGFLKIKKELTDHLNEFTKNLWLSENYRDPCMSQSVKLIQVENEAKDYIVKYAPAYLKTSKGVKLLFKNYRDIVPFIRTLGNNAVISKQDNPRLFNTFKQDISEQSDYYNNKTDSDPQKFCNPVDNNNLENQISNSLNKQFVKEDTKCLTLFNQFNSYYNILLEDIHSKSIKNKEDIISIEPIIKDSFNKRGFRTEHEYYNRLLKQLAENFKNISDNNDSDWVSDVFLKYEETIDYKGSVSDIKISLAENDDSKIFNPFYKKPVQIFTNYEYEYLYHMLQDKEARCFFDEETLNIMTETLESHKDVFVCKKFDDVILKRFVNSKASCNERKLRANIITVSQAIHEGKKIIFKYKGKQRGSDTLISGTPYRISYSLRERVLRVIFKADTDENEWIERFNLDRMNEIRLTDESGLSDAKMDQLLRKKKKYIELVVHKNSESNKRKVFERALRSFSSYEKYAWDDNDNNDYVIAIVYYNFDIALKIKDNKRICRMDTVLGDILALGKYAEVLSEPRIKLSSSVDYDSDLYNTIKGYCASLNALYMADDELSESNTANETGKNPTEINPDSQVK